MGWGEALPFSLPQLLCHISYLLLLNLLFNHIPLSSPYSCPVLIIYHWPSRFTPFLFTPPPSQLCPIVGHFHHIFPRTFRDPTALAFRHLSPSNPPILTEAVRWELSYLFSLSSKVVNVISLPSSSLFSSLVLFISLSLYFGVKTVFGGMGWVEEKWGGSQLQTWLLVGSKTSGNMLVGLPWFSQQNHQTGLSQSQPGRIWWSSSCCWAWGWEAVTH